MCVAVVVVQVFRRHHLRTSVGSLAPASPDGTISTNITSKFPSIYLDGEDDDEEEETMVDADPLRNDKKFTILLGIVFLMYVMQGPVGAAETFSFVPHVVFMERFWCSQALYSRFTMLLSNHLVFKDVSFFQAKQSTYTSLLCASSTNTQTFRYLSAGVTFGMVHLHWVFSEALLYTVAALSTGGLVAPDSDDCSMWFTGDSKYAMTV